MYGNPGYCELQSTWSLRVTESVSECLFEPECLRESECVKEMEEEMMEAKFNGENNQRKEYRRSEDKVCALHGLLWQQHDSSTREHRDLVCSKITKLETMLMHKADATDIQDLKGDIRGMVPWRALTAIFAVLFVMVTGAITVTGWFISRDQRSIEASVSKGNEEVKEAISVLHRRISEGDRIRADSVDGIKDKMNSMGHSLERIGERLSTVENQLQIRNDRKNN